MITLLSDWKLRDPYIGIFKGQLLKFLPNEQIVDITHSLELFNLSQAAFIAKNSYPFFSENTLHIILSGLSFSPESKPVLVVHKGHFFLGEDTGIFSMMFAPDNNIEAYQYNGDMSLSATEKLATVASLVFKKNYAKEMMPYSSLKFQLSNLSEPDNTDPNVISGKIAYIDSCCNAVTNIPISLFENAENKQFTAIVSSNTRPLFITRFHPYYNPKETEIFLTYNSLGFLEITFFEGNIAALADIKIGNNVEIKFE